MIQKRFRLIDIIKFVALKWSTVWYQQQTVDVLSNICLLPHIWQMEEHVIVNQILYFPIISNDAHELFHDSTFVLILVFVDAKK